MTNNRKNNAAAADPDGCVYNEYVRVFQPIMPDEFMSSDEKLDRAVEKMMKETIDDLPLHRSVKKGGEGSKAHAKKAKKDTKASSGNGGKKLSGLQLFFIFLAVIVVVFGGIYVGIAQYYTDHFIRGTFINGMAVDDLTVDEVTASLADYIDKYSIQLHFRDGSEAEITGADFDYHFTPGDTIRNLLEEQNEWLWFNVYLNKTVHKTVDETVSYDAEALEALAFSLDEFSEANQTAPENAYLTVEEDHFVIVPETEGNRINRTVFMQGLTEAVNSAADSFDAAIEGVYETAAVTKDDEDLKAQCQDLNAFLDTTVTYELYEGKEAQVDRSRLIDWVDKSSDGYYFINTDTLKTDISAYVEELADMVDSKKETRLFNSTKRGQCEITCPAYGTIVDREGEAEALYSNLIERRSETRKPVYSQDDGEKDPSFGGTYVEVDIENQHMYYYKDGVLTVDSDVVTGLSYQYPTPKGVYAIYAMQKNRILRGQQLPDGTFEYETPVSYWMPFYRGYGLHDATWRGAFGGTIYKTGGSHGCVNLPLDVAGRLYDVLEVDTPVIVF